MTAPPSPKYVENQHRKPDRPVAGDDLLIGSFTLAVWMGAFAVGVIGMLIHYAPASIPPRMPAPVVVQNLQIELTKDPTPPVVGPPKVDKNKEAGKPAEEPPLPVPPPLPEVAKPSPAMAFATPMEGPVRIVETPAPAPSTPAPAAAAATQVSSESGKSQAPGPARRIMLGVGEGKQPAPDYPPEAIKTGQEGRVAVRFTVEENGHVASADVVEPCKWPLLNRAVARKIREAWRFAPGPVRVYDVDVSFKLQGD